MVEEKKKKTFARKASKKSEPKSDNNAELKTEVATETSPESAKKTKVATTKKTKTTTTKKAVRKTASKKPAAKNKELKELEEAISAFESDQEFSVSEEYGAEALSNGSSEQFDRVETLKESRSAESRPSPLPVQKPQSVSSIAEKKKNDDAQKQVIAHVDVGWLIVSFFIIGMALVATMSVATTQESVVYTTSVMYFE